MNDLFSHPILHDMFVLGVPILEKVLRPWLVYVFLIVGLRLAGKRGLAQLNTFDLIVLLTLSNTVQNAIIGDDNSVTGGVIGATSLLVINYVVVRFLFRRMRLDRFLEGSPTPLIEGGRLVRKNLERELITEAELQAAAHRQGFRDLGEVERAIIEAGGSIAFIGKDPSPMRTHYDDLVRRLEQISQQLQALQPRAERG
ncbi:MAG TPA: YetF domain-containing protein [Roseiflexaceae bacterium]